ncbi:MAG TPA: TetR/AcrR family transcriptional regulator C-terminal domain-containing protein [Candidatus Limnocylindrales bacterium]|nr:TetR/AcrR family transcriptional regulator C-terminal domain-containing protein [Candidatus Limnocylindrales bacterium]
MGRPAKFSREQLQAAALALVDRDGLESLSMRSLAAELGTGAMTLYNHVEHREDLEMLVVEAVIAGTRWKGVEHDDWRDDVRQIAIAMWRAVRAHPATIPLILTRRSSSPAVLDLSEALLAALARSGRSGRQLLIAFRALTAIVTGFAQVELAAPLITGRKEKAKEVIARVRALPEDRYARLREIAKAATTSKPESEFRSGLDLFLAGLGDEAPLRKRRIK